MATFRVYLVGTSQPILIDVSANSISELSELASHVRFIEGKMAEPDDDGLFPGVLFQACRIQLAFEVN